ncbi:hypothetical protein BGW80DRAFT_1434199 [Lactifluus volemus]|nr:hypothetical protein BGW80DRAFT_1434199 [Lactifluus volemus]
MRYTVFLGAPPPSTTSTLSDDELSFQWHTVESTTKTALKDTSTESFPVYHSAELDAASRQISTMYENIIFGEEDEDKGDTQIVEEDLMRGTTQGDKTTLTTWVAMTQPEGRSEAMNSLPLFASTTRLSIQNNMETQDFSTGGSYSEASSSIARFPAFQFSLSALSFLASARGKVCLLLSVLEVDGPDEVTVRRGPDAGHVVSVLRLIVGDEANTIRKLTAWREIAETWGGATQAEGVRRGDVVYFESVLATDTESANGGLTPVLTASPNLRSRAEICFRTMPRPSVPADMHLRPDLRLSASDAAVRRVAAVVAWFERMAGLSGARSGPGVAVVT